jgi:hypothetical protein
MAAQYRVTRAYMLCLLALVGCARHDSHAARYSAELMLAKADKPALQRKANDLRWPLAGAQGAYDLTLRTGERR